MYLGHLQSQLLFGSTLSWARMSNMAKMCARLKRGPEKAFRNVWWDWFPLLFSVVSCRCLNMGIESPWSCYGGCPDRKRLVCLYWRGPVTVRTTHCLRGAILWSSRIKVDPLSLVAILQRLFQMRALATQLRQVPGFTYCKVGQDVEQPLQALVASG